MTKNIKTSVEKIYDTLTRQGFHEWYMNGNWDAHVLGAENAPTKEEICKEIEKWFTEQKP